MKTIALRFAENFAPPCGTIAAHAELILTHGFVWYGKLGAPVSQKVVDEILGNEDPRILLIHSGGMDRWWAHIAEIRRKTPEMKAIPEYYRDNAADFSCWFKVVKFVKAPKNVMQKCVVTSSGKPLSLASRQSMSPYFIVEYLAER